MHLTNKLHKVQFQGHWTVPRAEAWACLALLQYVNVDTQIEFITDCLPFFNSYKKGIEGARVAANSDILLLIFESIEIKRIKLDLRWMPSHLDTHPVKAKPEWVELQNIIGNSNPDRLATATTDSGGGPGGGDRQVAMSIVGDTWWGIWIG